MESYITMLIIVCPLVFLAGFVDAVAGGGGLISLPAYIFAGVPIHVAYGTNKFANSIGTAVATSKFFKSGNIKLKLAILSSIGAIIGSWLGAKLVLILDEKYLHYCLMIILPIVAVFLLFNRSFGSVEEEKEIKKKDMYFMSLIIGFIIGGYDGFFGPGTGTFLVLAFTSLLGFNLITASGNAKVVNLASNIGALIAYILGSKVSFAIGIPAAVCSVAGNYIGAHLAVKNGAKFIKPIILLVVGMLFIKVLLGFFDL